MFATIREVLIDPDGYFAEHASDPRLLPPVAVVVAYILFSSLAYLPLLLRFDTEVTTILTYGLLGVLLTNGAIAVIAWLVLALGCQAISFVLGGNGSFRRTGPLIGWGFLPLLGGHLLVLVATAIAIQGAPPIPVENPEQAAIAADSLMSGRAIQIATYAYTALYLWSCYVLVYVLKHVRDLSMRRAFITVLIPMVVVNLLGLL